MKTRKLAGGVSATYVAVLDEGEEAFSALSSWAVATRLSAAQVTAIGAFERAVVGWFDR
ncbi:MAG: PCC domain-containing protein, partial [Trebonia sp.]